MKQRRDTKSANRRRRAGILAALAMLAATASPYLLAQTAAVKSEMPASAAKKSSGKATRAKSANPPAKPGLKGDSANRKVIYQGSTVTSTGEVYPGVAPGKDLTEQKATADLMQSAAANLSTLAQPRWLGKLSDEQLATKSQAKTFLDQANQAAHDGDLPRARTLAKKAKLLSDSLLGW